MGLFGFKKRNAGKTQKMPTETKINPVEKQFAGSSLERDLTQEVAICINSMKITEMPILKFFHNDKGFFEGVFQSHIDDPNVLMIKKTYGDQMYLNLLGCHALGTGAYITLCQSKYKKPIEDFTVQEATEIAQAFRQTDPYELALNTLGYSLDGNNKKCVDHIIVVAMNTYRKAAGVKAYDRENLKIYMQVLFNAGITIVLR